MSGYKHYSTVVVFQNESSKLYMYIDLFILCRKEKEEMDPQRERSSGYFI